MSASPLNMVHYDVIILGAGAAGMFCALTAGNRGRRVLLIEHNEHPGMKIRISGGGRCNFTNIHASPENYISSNPNFCRSALARFTPAQFLSLVESHRIRWHEKKLGQLFCDTSSRAIISMLLEECDKAGVHIQCETHIQEITKPNHFRLRTSRGTISSEAVVIATGGLSFPKLGATNFGYQIAKQFNIPLIETRPGLVPLTSSSNERHFFSSLSGVSLPVRVKSRNQTFDEALLFTHRGLSGPVILQISSYWREGETLTFDLLPTLDGMPVPSRASAATQLARFWPQRFAEAWCAQHTPPKPVAQWTSSERERVQHLLHHWPLQFSGTEGYPKAEVTLGGVDTRALSSKTMEARDVSGLYFIGEVIDVTGWLGGYNLQWAWSSAHAAGIAV